MILSILIASIYERSALLDALLEDLSAQIKLKSSTVKSYSYGNHIHLTGEKAEVHVLIDNRKMTIGWKRQKLLEMSAGEWVVYIDDDDKPSPEYVELILAAASLNPDADCMATQGVISTNGKDHRRWFISLTHGKWHEKDKVYYRTPNHISPVKRSIAIQAGFNVKMNNGEDADYSMRIFPMLKKEAVIKQDIYHYKYSSKK